MTKTPMELARIKIAEATLKMPEPILGVMGGMTKEEAKKVLAETGRKRVAWATGKRRRPFLIER